ncbi:MAG: hypothetical protein H9882_06050 [Candidatus Fournierella pullistercoris]|uniref:DUF4019 domain-containing protein n=1 Tax=Candidatus Allofournierella pullistercoris TaxID=2838597 RepID=A0A948WRF5_9FIRM|nr:hypothetical protein [Candidatus Fournierella pullistercoris]
MKSFPLSCLISLLALAAGLLTACSPNLNQTAKEWNGADARTLATVCAALEWDIRDGEVSRLISEDVLATREYNSDSEWGLGRPQTYGDMAEFVDTYYSNIQIRESVYNSFGEVALLVSYRSPNASFYYITGTFDEAKNQFTSFDFYSGMDTFP